MSIRSHERDAIVGTLLSKLGVFTEEAISWVDHGDIVQLCNTDDFILSKIRPHRCEL